NHREGAPDLAQRSGADAAGPPRLRHAREARRRRAMKTVPRGPAIAAGFLVLAAVLLLGFSVGGVHLSVGDLVGGEGEAGQTARMLAARRLPRVLLASLVGACLALAGAALQALLKNPLADPFLLGTSGGAAAGAACAALVGASPLVSPAAAFLGAAAAPAGG